MYSKIIPYTGNGEYQDFELNFDPSAVLVLPSVAGSIAYHAPEMWCARTNFFGALDTVGNGLRLQGRRVLIGNSSTVNADGVAYTALVLGSQDGDIAKTSYMGNATAGRVVKMPRAGVPIFGCVKRDNPMPPVVRIPGYPCRAADTTSIGADAFVMNDGTITVSAENYVNQYDGTQTLGEGIDALMFYAGSANPASTGNFTGNNNARNIAVPAGTGSLWLWRTDNAGGSTVAMFIVNGDGSVKTSNASAPAVGVGTLTDGNLALTGASLNATGGTYVWVAIPLNDPASPLPQAPALNLSGRKALRFEGRGAAGSADFGTGLNIADEITQEWFGWTPCEPNQSDNFDAWLIGKAGGSYGNTAGNASWGISAVNRITENSLNWAGPQIASVVSRRIYYAGPINVASWRTGVSVPYGMHLWQYVKRTDGTCELWRDGKRVKQRAITTDSLTADGTTHRVTMGSRWTGAAMAQPSRMAIASARVYSRGLTDSELLTRSEIVLAGSAAADITLGLAADWNAADIVGTAWADRAGSNDGTIIGGTVVDL